VREALTRLGGAADAPGGGPLYLRDVKKVRLASEGEGKGQMVEGGRKGEGEKEGAWNYGCLGGVNMLSL